MKTIFCLASFFKGEEFLRSAKREGNRVFLLTSENLKQKSWPKDSVDEFFYMLQNAEGDWNGQDMVDGFAFLSRTHQIDAIVALDDFDVERAALLREEFRIPGMGQTTARLFRDKLAMRIQAGDQGIPVPDFTALFNDVQINEFLDRTSPPWMIKPRGEASAIGIYKVHTKDEFWQKVHDLGELRPQYLGECFLEGDVYHVDALSFQGKIVFHSASQYLDTPFKVAHGGGIFRSITLTPQSTEAKALLKVTTKLMVTFGMQNSASHSEFLKNKADGKFYLIETSSRVGGAHLADMVEASTGVNLWREWARMESAVINKIPYLVSPSGFRHAGIVITLSKYKDTDSSFLNHPSIVWRLDKEHHVGFIAVTDTRDELLQVVNHYTEIIQRDYSATVPIRNKAQH